MKTLVFGLIATLFLTMFMFFFAASAMFTEMKERASRRKTSRLG